MKWCSIATSSTNRTNKMELRVDLSDRADIEAAHALLAVVLGETKAESSGYVPVTVVSAGTLATPPAHLLDGTQGGVMGNGAPSTADAGGLPSVPEGLLAGAQNDTSASTSSAAVTDPQLAGAPSAPAAPASPAPGGVPLDKEGIPHDTRIHSNPPSINKGDGMWRAKKGLNDAALVARVKAELKALMAIPAGSAPSAGTTPPAGSAAPAPVAPPASAPVAPPAPVPTASAAPTPPATPAAPAVASSATPPTTPQELIPRVTSANASGILPQSALLDACLAYGLPNIPALFQRPDKVSEVYQYLTLAYPAFA